jgi:hypothetical protein
MIDASLYAVSSQTVLKFWRSLDHGDFDSLIGLLMPDARWNRAGKWREGHSDIRTALSERPPNLFVRHLITNLLGERDDSGIQLRYMLIAHSCRRVEGDAAPFPAGPPTLIVDYASTCVETPDGWKLSSLSGTQVFSAHAKT